jgi:outer membrane protein
LRRGYLPNLKAKANYNQLLQRDDLFDSNELGFIPQSSVSLGINIPIYDGARKKGQIQQAQVDLERVELQKSEFERAMNMQVQNARLQYMNASKTLENREKSLEIVEDIYNKTSIKFSEGIGSSIELIQAEQLLFEAQGNYINALYDLLISKTDLDIALGNI